MLLLLHAVTKLLNTYTHITSLHRFRKAQQTDSKFDGELASRRHIDIPVRTRTRDEV